MNTSPWILLLAPLIAAVVNGVFLRRLWGGWPALFISIVSATFTALVSARFLVYTPVSDPGFDWISIGDFTISLGLKFDELSLGMMFVVTLVGWLVHIFSVVYMFSDEAKGRYFAGLSLFMFSMTGIVLADNFVMMFIFWELVGVSSYILIGHYFKKNSAAEACKKAFLVNRIGDFGFMSGILILWAMTGTIAFDEMRGAVEGGGFAAGMITAATLLIFCGALGKSAQFPLHVWLPDAMEGPTPVSALIHAATMVAAGVYMLVRVDFLIAASVTAGQVIAGIGAITAALAAIIAIQQSDIKRILAYSTLSQLGYMVMAVGLGGEHGSEAGMFHLYTHAFFKALLFLGAGAVIHACHHEQDIWKMGGLFKKMPITSLAFVIGTLALIAVPGMSGFFSKEAILYEAKGHPVFFWTAAGVAVLTAFYMTRLVLVAFFNKPRSEHSQGAKEVNWMMLAPLLILAALSIVSAYPPFTERLKAMSVVHGEHMIEVGFVFYVSLGALIIGVVAAFILYAGKDSDPVNIKPLKDKLYFDEIYGSIVKYGQDFLANILYAIDQLLIGVVAVTGSAKLVERVGILLRRLQSGQLQAYGLVFALGAIILLCVVLAR